MKRNKSIIVIALVLTIFFISGCTSESSSTAISSPNSNVQTITNEQKQTDVLTTATHASVNTMESNWDADAEDDGTIVYPELRDSNDETVKFEGISLNVDIEIWATKFDDSFNEVRDRLVYSGSGTINSWKDGNFLFKGGIKIPFEDIKALPSDNEFGEIAVKIHTPDGKVFEAKSSLAKIRAE